MGRIKCLMCGEELESKSRHDFQMCGCENGAFIDGGNDYTRWGAKFPDKIEVNGLKIEELDTKAKSMQRHSEAMALSRYVESLKPAKMRMKDMIAWANIDRETGKLPRVRLDDIVLYPTRQLAIKCRPMDGYKTIRVRISEVEK